MTTEASPRFPPGFARAMAGESATPALAEALAEDALTLAGGVGQVAVLRSENLCAAIYDAAGAALLTTSGWRAAGLDPDLELLAATPIGQPVAAGDDEDTEGLQPLFMRADMATARGWALPPELASALQLPGAVMLVVAVLPVAADAVLRAGGRALGLTDLQCRVLEAVLKTGSIRSAAVAADVAYDTARSAVSDALARAGLPKLPALLDRLAMLTLGVWPVGGAGDAGLVADMLGLTERQGRLALALALGLTRAEAAAASGMSPAVAKKEIDQLFIVAGVGSAAALVRRLAETRALALLAGVSGGGVVWANEGMAPLQLVMRADGSRIAVSDYGPVGCPPVLVLHSSMTSRHVAGPLLKTLQHAGWRVLAIDRPGFGLSDMVVGACPFAAAAADMVTVMDTLKLSRVAVVARGAAQVALAAGRMAPARLGPVVLVNPDPPSGLSGDGAGVVAAIKSVLWRNPALVAGFARLLSSQLSPAKAETIIRRTVEASAPDRAFMDDPRNVADYYRATRAFLTGRVQGYVAEQQAFATMAADAPLPGTRDWTVLLGEVDVIHDPGKVADYWCGVLPDAAHVVVGGAGRFLAMTHGERVVAALAGANTGKI